LSSVATCLNPKWVVLVVISCTCMSLNSIPALGAGIHPESLSFALSKDSDGA